jgi:hypothetical protein
VLVPHEHLDDEQRVDRLACLCQLLEPREHHAGKR